MPTPQEEVLEMLADWRFGKPWARKDPKTLRIASVEAIEPTQIVLRSVFETRLIRYEFKASKRPVYETREPDPWATEVTFPLPLGVGTEQRVPLDLEVNLRCAVCASEGKVTCRDCRGTGQATLTKGHCYTCDGETRVMCKTCDGGGGVCGSPTVIARLDAHDEIRTLGTDALPLDIVFALGDSPAAGTLIHRQQDTRITELRVMPTGYRDGQALAPPLLEAARSVLMHSGVPENARVQQQTLELKRTTLFEVRLKDGSRFYVWDSPPKVHPKAPVATWLGRLLVAR